MNERLFDIHYQRNHLRNVDDIFIFARNEAIFATVEAEVFTALVDFKVIVRIEL